VAKNRGEWPAPLILILRDMWGSGVSARLIGIHLTKSDHADRTFSKGAVIGKAHRLELDERPSPIRRYSNAELDAWAVLLNTYSPTHSRPIPAAIPKHARTLFAADPTLAERAPQVEPTQSVALVVADTEPEGDVMMVESAPSVVVETPPPVPEPKPTPAPAQLAEPPAFRHSPPPKVTPIKRLTCQYPHGHPREPGFHFCDAPVWACEDPTRYDPEKSVVYCAGLLTHQPTPMRRAA
jgi:GcrA cell cycle regulator